MARITVEDCQERVNNRFLLVQMVIKRVAQYREGYEALVGCNNKEIVTALREIASGKIIPDDFAQYNPMEGQVMPDPNNLEALSESQDLRKPKIYFEDHVD
ncbi:DNA-directed RNA polymerase subunit omega [Desulfovibrio litoralis DSM 11393]|uniref:DNA-directed RNA polymerase subunit omega n=1 Tax=Desulfovibrio litoralis DSM 11393 TaxID=1121455 RepID=A0A1M7RTI0_9BACT|nr:DNA-directed RNA polymerase subunit omega [Desulfovibrio litoralis DSM 11393]